VSELVSADARLIGDHVERKRIGIALLIGASLEAALYAADSGVWHPPTWTQIPGFYLGFTIADQLHLHDLKLYGFVALGLVFLVQGFLFSVSIYLLLICASRILPRGFSK
jgi:hypothetical protein